MMKWIGLTGSIGTGKSAVARILRESGHSVIDADQMARQVVQKGKPAHQAILAKWGQEILLADGQINRPKLGEIVFNSKESRLWLDSLVHPEIQKEVLLERRTLEQKGSTIAFYDIPLLFEKNLQKNFDAIVLVAAEKSLQIQRIKERNHLSLEEVESRIAAQIPVEQKVKEANLVIYNNGTLDDLQSAVRSQLIPWINLLLKHPTNFPKS